LATLSFNDLKLKETAWGSALTDIQIPQNWKFRHSERANTYAWEGFVYGDATVAVAAFTPKSQKLYEVTLIIGDPLDFPAARYKYMTYQTRMTKLYGKHTHHYNIIQEPYFKNGGYDTLALKDGKYNFSHFWNNFSNTFIGMAITPEGWTAITFESKQYRKVALEEGEKL